MMLSGIEKRAFEQARVETKREDYENLLKLGVPEEIARQAIYNGLLPNFDPKED